MRCLLPLFVACAPSIRPDPLADAAPSDGGGRGDAISPTGRVTTVRHPDSTSSTLVDATSETAWTYVDFETSAEIAETGPWDLRFQRFHISTNGAAGVEAAPIQAEFGDITEAPASGYLSDADVDGDGKIDYAFDQNGAWYEYDQATHVLKPKRLVWVARTAGGGTVKLTLENYYDAFGTSGWITFHWTTL
jgi:hypothetical protein